MPRLVPARLPVALLALLALGPAESRAGDRLLPSKTPVLLDGTGQAIGLAFPQDEGLFVHAWIRIEGRDLMFNVGRDILSPDSPGQVFFGQPGCAGPPLFVPPSEASVFTPIAEGPGGLIYAAEGPPVIANLLSSWNPFVSDPCQAEPGNGFFQVEPAVPILDRASFPPPYTIR